MTQSASPQASDSFSCFSLLCLTTSLYLLAASRCLLFHCRILFSIAKLCVSISLKNFSWNFWVSECETLPEDMELTRQMNALGLPVSFRTNKEVNYLIVFILIEVYLSSIHI